MWQMIEQNLQSPLHGWSMGSFGAIGEFMWDANEHYYHLIDGRLGCITDRGGLAAENIMPSESRLLRTATRVAIRQYEQLHPDKKILLAQWRQRFDKALENPADVSKEAPTA